MFDSAVSLRDIERFRQIYGWFVKNLAQLKSKAIPVVLGAYNNREERAAVMALYFTYLLRVNFVRRVELEIDIESSLGLGDGFVKAVKNTE